MKARMLGKVTKSFQRQCLLAFIRETRDIRRVHLTKDVWKWALLCRLLFGWMVRLWTRWPEIEHVYISTTNISTTKIIPTKTHVYVTYGMKRLADSFRISPRLPQLAIQLPQLGVWACHLLQSCPMVVPELNLSSQKFS